jgi:hypothetical protein
LILARAEEWGMKAFVCGYLMCFEMSLRAIDVRGQPATDLGQGDITKNGGNDRAALHDLWLGSGVLSHP